MGLGRCLFFRGVCIVCFFGVSGRRCVKLIRQLPTHLPAKIGNVVFHGCFRRSCVRWLLVYGRHLIGGHVLGVRAILDNCQCLGYGFGGLRPVKIIECI